MKNFLYSTGLALALLAAPSAAQSGSDDGLSSARGATVVGGGSIGGVGCGSGTTTTFYNNSNGQAGVMIDVAVGGSDITIECIDLSFRTAGLSSNIEVFAVPGTCVGKDVGDLCAHGWTLIGTGTVISGGSNVPVNVNLTPPGAPYVFSANATYGLYITVANYTSGGSGVSYTNGGPTNYVGTHCTVTTYYGKGAYTPPCTLGATFTPREFNGTLYTELAGPAGPALSVSGTCPGSTTLSFSNCTPTSTVAVLYGLAGSFTKPGNPCGGLVLGINNPTLGAMISTNGAGNATLTFNAPAAACGKTVQGVDVASCTATNTVVL